MTRLLGASRALARASFARPASALAANSGLDSEAEGTVNKLLARWDEYKASNTTHVAPMSSMSSHPDVLLSEKPKVVLLEGIHEAAVAMLKRSDGWQLASIVAGTIMVFWIVGEVASIRAFHFLQVIYLVTGALVVIWTPGRADRPAARS